MHIAGEMELDLSFRIARVTGWDGAAQIRMGEYATTVVAKPGTGIGQAYPRRLGAHVDLHAALMRTMYDFTVPAPQCRGFRFIGMVLVMMVVIHSGWII